MRAEQPVSVVVFAPHPDDEVIAVGGTICWHRAHGDRVAIVFSTDGSASHAAVLGIHDDPRPEVLAQIRQGEARAAAAELRVNPDDVLLLHFTDTKLSSEMELFTAAVVDVLHRHPEVSTIYLPDPDREMNADHRITGIAVLKAVQHLQLSPRLFKYVVWDKDLEQAFMFQNRLDLPCCIDDSEAVEQVDITPFHREKLNAMAQHRTQVEMFSRSQVRPVVPAWLMNKMSDQKYEQFRVHSLTR